MIVPIESRLIPIFFWILKPTTFKKISVLKKWLSIHLNHYYSILGRFGIKHHIVFASKLAYQCPALAHTCPVILTLIRQHWFSQSTSFEAQHIVNQLFFVLYPLGFTNLNKTYSQYAKLTLTRICNFVIIMLKLSKYSINLFTK